MFNFFGGLKVTRVRKTKLIVKDAQGQVVRETTILEDGGLGQEKAEKALEGVDKTLDELMKGMDKAFESMDNLFREVRN